MRAVGHRLQGWAVHAGFALLRALGPVRASNLGGWIARKIGPWTRPHRIADANLRNIMPDKTAIARAAILDGMWDNLGRVVGELPHLAALDIAVEGVDILADLRARGQPVLFFSAHYGNWEAMAPALARLDFSTLLIYRRANVRPVNDAILGLRTEAGGLLAAKGPEASRAILRAVRQGQSIAMLVDQKMNDGVPLPFFGRPAMTATAIADLALKYGWPILPARCLRLGPGRFKIILEEPMRFDLTGDKREAARAIMTAVNARIENWVRERPDHWFWVHRRWGAAFLD